MSYLSLKEVERKLEEVKEEVEFEKEEYGRKIEIAKQLTKTIAFNYPSLLKEKSDAMQ